MEREVGGGIGMGNTCKPMAVSFQCMTKFTTKKKKKKNPQQKIKIKNKLKKIKIKKYLTPLLTLERGGTLRPLLMSMSEAFSACFYTLINICYTKKKKIKPNNIPFYVYFIYIT